MIDINHVVLIGRLTRDAEYKVLPSGQAVCNFSIAVNRRKKVGDNWEDEAGYFDIVLWGKQADSINRYLVKGKQIAIDGELRQDRWQQDGQNRSKVIISANNVELLGSAGGGGYSSAEGNYGGGGASYSGGGYGGGASYSGGAPAQGYGGAGGQSGGAPAQGGGERNFEDDIPF